MKFPKKNIRNKGQNQTQKTGKETQRNPRERKKGQKLLKEEVGGRCRRV
jgi:hypothetical protein